ncbi:unnamed protein product [Prunus armeniaca]|uniref:Leucine-rich repeat-containing N-terminal plant-type domain-containing protein n=1 Tax=Prunus armeniaca TaxID=36596 RepID=A0A6J5V9C2_PRUAR|nr:unnamed protein product [Prunus armeniaca]
MSSDDQQSLLLQLKNSLKFDSAKSNKLKQWKNGSDYCSWEGVSCKDGCVSHLDLSSESISGGLDNSSALFDLQHIENLNLAYNNFNNTQIPSKFDSLDRFELSEPVKCWLCGADSNEISLLKAQGTEWCEAISSSLPKLRSSSQFPKFEFLAPQYFWVRRYIPKEDLPGQINSSHWENHTNLVNLDLRFNLLDGDYSTVSVFSSRAAETTAF